MKCALFIAIVSIPLAAFQSASSKAVIVNSGSTNAPGFQIVVSRDGSATLTPTRRGSQDHADSAPVQRKISPSLVQRLFEDLDAAKPLSELPRQRCVKSASLGTSLNIEFAGAATPDLSCPGASDPRIQKLHSDADEVAAVFRSN